MGIVLGITSHAVAREICALQRRGDRWSGCRRITASIPRVCVETRHVVSLSFGPADFLLRRSAVTIQTIARKRTQMFSNDLPGHRKTFNMVQGGAILQLALMLKRDEIIFHL